MEKILFVKYFIAKEKVKDNELLFDGLNISSNVNSMIKKMIIGSSANSPNSNKTLIALFFLTYLQINSTTIE